MTAEEFAQLPDSNQREELVQGEVVARPLSGYHAGVISANLLGLLYPHIEKEARLGTLVGYNGVVVARNPDTVRGPDGCYYSFERIPRGIRIPGYPSVLPEVVVEIRHFYETWADVMEPVGEYLAVEISAIVIDPDSQKIHIYEKNRPERVLRVGDTFDLPALWPGLAFPVADLFD